ncbi:MAG: DUF1501 domain-containing protein [Planctomycetes bacterium]|nr:DUF1501 domain-containing protein [Planctomycetota bacterium]
MLDRRSLLFAASLAPWVLARRSRAHTEDSARPRRSERSDRPDRALIVFELTGGNDGLNTLIPFEDDRYHRARPTLAIRKHRALALDATQGLHPALPGLRASFERGELAIARGLGSPSPDLSHFKSQDAWSAASVADVPPPTGWVGRLHDVAQRTGAWSPSALALLAVGRDTPPPAFAAEHLVAPACMDLTAFARAPVARPSALGIASTRVAELALADAAARDAADELARAARTRVFGAYPATALGEHARMAAQLRIAGLPTRVIWITAPSFDTHTRQEREHEILLGRLDASLAALRDDLARAGLLASTAIATVSEFGRRVSENGVGAEAGTDHGTASIAFLLGGGVRGGFVGAPSDLGDLDGDGNLRATLDFRDWLATLVAHLRVEPADVLGPGRVAFDVLGGRA